jgi:hypothetical protein
VTAQTLREPRQDRSRATRRRLFEAAIDCLASIGWARTTVALVAERAGVSRGAAQHHFPAFPTPAVERARGRPDASLTGDSSGRPPRA